MARGVNTVILVGNVVKEPTIKYPPNGICMATLILSTTNVHRSKVTGEKIEDVQYHRVLAFQRLGEIFGRLKKGGLIHVEGRLQTRRWIEPDSEVERFVTEIVAHEMTMLEYMPDRPSANKNQTYSEEQEEFEENGESQPGNSIDDDQGAFF